MDREELATLFIELDAGLKEQMIYDVDRRGMKIRTWLTDAIKEKLERESQRDDS